jgi:hypothetical protein
MSFQVRALPFEPFAALFSMDDAQLRERGAMRRIADSTPAFPCRVSLADASAGETVILLNFEHQSADTPFRASHAIYVRKGASQAQPKAREIPQMLRRRLLSVRAFDDDGMMLEADVVDGWKSEVVIERMLAPSRVSYLHLHNAKYGCYFARVDRA